MTGSLHGLTPYPDVNAVLDLVLTGAQAVLGSNFVGMYLFGPLASGGFEPESSDMDFLVVTADDIPEEVIPALEAMHRGITDSGTNGRCDWMDRMFLARRFVATIPTNRPSLRLTKIGSMSPDMEVAQSF